MDGEIVVSGFLVSFFAIFFHLRELRIKSLHIFIIVLVTKSLVEKVGSLVQSHRFRDWRLHCGAELLLVATIVTNHVLFILCLSLVVELEQQLMFLRST